MNFQIKVVAEENGETMLLTQFYVRSGFQGNFWEKETTGTLEEPVGVGRRKKTSIVKLCGGEQPGKNGVPISVPGSDEHRYHDEHLLTHAKT